MFLFQHKKLFVDESFPPTPRSLYYSPNENKEGHVVKWRRPKDIPVDNSPDKTLSWAVFRTPLPSDISQGNFIVFYIATLKIFSKINHLNINLYL